jgi:hypothetical protein
LFIDEFSQFCSQSGTALERILTLTRKFGLTLNLACQTLSQTKEIHDALQNTIHISFKMGYEDAVRIAPGFLDSTVREEPDLWQSLFSESHSEALVSDGESKQEWVRLIKNLQKQECLVHISGKTWKVKTLGVSDVPAENAELLHIKNTYASLLLTPRIAIQQQIGEAVPQSSASVVDLSAHRSRQGRKKSSTMQTQQQAPHPFSSLPVERATLWEDIPDEEA